MNNNKTVFTDMKHDTFYSISYNFGIKTLYILHNYNPLSKNYDEKCIGWGYENGRKCPIIQRTYY